MKALVLSAGLGTRLGGLTRDTPKAMLPIAGEPLLAHTLRHLAMHGFDHVAVNVFFRADTLIDYFGDGAAYGVEIHWEREERLLGTAGSVKRLESYFANCDDFLVIYGDLLTDEDLSALVAAHRQRAQAMATLLVHRRLGANSVLSLDDDQRIIGFVERPPAGFLADTECWVNSGLQVLSRRLLARIPSGQVADLPRDVYIPALAEEKFYGFPLTGYRCAIDSPERYLEAQQAVESGRCRVAQRGRTARSVC